jgi:phasin family protein
MTCRPDNANTARQEITPMAANDPMKQIETFTADAQKTMNEQVEKVSKSFEDIATFNQETFDALIKSQNLAAKAAEELNAEIVAFSKKSMEESVAHAKALTSAQTVSEFIEKQAGFTKMTLDSLIAQSTKMNEMMLDAMKGTFEPMTARMNAAVDMVKSQTAA